ncbi:hypothetical protein GBA52_027160 [Prunus armeniaca]|nr:hypothetical protein GBA52_026795 [Prunus armeniaca]KAH0977441.1 hypothetical protein GBA52_027160 [Prunus armeniaca]
MDNPNTQMHHLHGVTMSHVVLRNWMKGIDEELTRSQNVALALSFRDADPTRVHLTRATRSRPLVEMACRPLVLFWKFKIDI